MFIFDLFIEKVVKKPKGQAVICSLFHQLYAILLLFLLYLVKSCIKCKKNVRQTGKVPQKYVRLRWSSYCMPKEISPLGEMIKLYSVRFIWGHSNLYWGHSNFVGVGGTGSVKERRNECLI